MSESSNPLEYEIQLTPLALEMLAVIKDRREQAKLAERIDQLKTDPEKQGKALIDNLQDFKVCGLLGSAIASSTKLSRHKCLF
ncbi:type II toxin-antitoxin system RelE family toxin [Gloeocapsopsis crepidinum]|uniref:type II toxin-antitoxin system RelE family toxin n=1 Tax=Gloeocapsopsis crepidinum TaxID=693223 RepID=UPI001D143942|nr:hypothetical protein [Gloeocapsopsis crepidinum]